MREFHKQSIQMNPIHLQDNPTDDTCSVQIDEILDLLAAMMRKRQPGKAGGLRIHAQGDEEIGLGDFQK